MSLVDPMINRIDESTVCDSSQSNTLEQSLKFNENFWDDKLTGYLVLCQNIRNSINSVRELEIFLRDVLSAEDQYVRQMNKYTSQIHKFNQDSTIYPIWTDMVKYINEQNSNTHIEFMQKLSEMLKQVQSYSIDLRKRKKKLKENEAKTVQLIEQFRQSRQNLNRSKEQFILLSSELDKQRKLLELTQNNQVSLSTTNILKLEKKTTQSIEEYKQAIEKYNATRSEYEQKFIDSCDKFQEFEENHLTKMKQFFHTYLVLISNLNSNRNTNVTDASEKLDQYTNERLLNEFMLKKSTGQFRPIPVEFIQFSNDTEIFFKKNSLTTSMLADTTKLDSSSSLIFDQQIDLNNQLNNEQKRTIVEQNSFSNSKLINFFNIDFLTRLKQQVKSRDIQQSTTSSTQENININETNSTTASILPQKPKHLYEKVLKKAKPSSSKFKQQTSMPGLEQQSNLLATSLDETKFKSIQNNQPLSNSLDEENFKKLTESDLDDELLKLPKKNIVNKDQADMINLYELSDDEEFKKNQRKLWNDTDMDIDRDEHDSDSDGDNEDSDDSDDSDAPKKIVLRIKPISEINRFDQTASPDILNQISKNLQLKSTPRKKGIYSKFNYSYNNVNQNESISSIPSILNQNQTSSPSSPSIYLSPRSTSTFSDKIDEVGNSSVIINNSNNNNPPPLPPLPFNLQMKINQRLNVINEMKKDTVDVMKGLRETDEDEMKF